MPWVEAWRWAIRRSISETRWEVDARVFGCVGDGWRFDVSGFLARIDGFIQREAIASGPLVYGFRNRDVNLAGLELITEMAPDPLARLGLSVDGSFSVVRGENRETSIGIPEIPPWNLRVGLAWQETGDGSAFRAEAGDPVRRVAEPIRIQQPCRSTGIPTASIPGAWPGTWLVGRRVVARSVDREPL